MFVSYIFKWLCQVIVRKILLSKGRKKRNDRKLLMSSLQTSSENYLVMAICTAHEKRTLFIIIMLIDGELLFY